MLLEPGGPSCPPHLPATLHQVWWVIDERSTISISAAVRCCLPCFIRRSESKQHAEGGEEEGDDDDDGGKTLRRPDVQEIQLRSSIYTDKYLSIIDGQGKQENKQEL